MHSRPLFTEVGTPELSQTRARLLGPIMATLLVLLIGGLAIPRLSATMDECVYIQHGVRFWFTGDAKWLIDVGTLPLPFWVQNLPGAVFLKLTHGNIYASDPARLNLVDILTLREQYTLLFLARYTNLLLVGVGTIWSLWWVSRRWFGDRVALVAALCGALEPNLLAGYVLATADGMILPPLILSLYFYVKFLQTNQRSACRWAMLLFGLGCSLKLTVFPQGLLLLGAAFVVMLLPRVLAATGGKQKIQLLIRQSIRFGFHAVVFLSVGLLLSWMANAFVMGNLLGADDPNKLAYSILKTMGVQGTAAEEKVHQWAQLRVPGNLAALRSQIAHSRGGHPMSFLGVPGLRGPWYYYPYIFAMKTHLVIGLLGLLGFFIGKAWRSPVILGAILLVLLSCTMKISGGPRYFLILYLLVAVLAGLTVSQLASWRGARWIKASVLALALIATLLLTARSWPQFLTHTNPFWGGDSQGYLYADADYDWGQGLYEAFRVVEQRQITNVVYIHSGDPYFAIPEGHRMVQCDTLPQVLRDIQGHQVAIAESLLYSHPQQDPEFGPFYQALKKLAPPMRLTDTYFLCDLQEETQYQKLIALLGFQKLSP